MSFGKNPSPMSIDSFVALGCVCRYLRLKPALFLVAVSMVGCSRQETVTAVTPPVIENLRAVRDGFFEARRVLDRPPRSKDEIVQYVKKYGDPAQLFRSPDDGEELVVIYGTDPLSLESVANIWAYERRGKNGGRHFIRGKNIQRLGDDEFKKQTFPPGHKPAF